VQTLQKADAVKLYEMTLPSFGQKSVVCLNILIESQFAHIPQFTVTLLVLAFGPTKITIPLWLNDTQQINFFPNNVVSLKQTAIMRLLDYTEY
jgi:hypothetical protein